MTEAIHIAHSVSRKHGGNVHVRGYVKRGTWKHTQCIANADTLEEATETVLRNIRESHERDGLTAPSVIVNHGRLSAIIVDHWSFG